MTAHGADLWVGSSQTGHGCDTPLRIVVGQVTRVAGDMASAPGGATVLRGPLLALVTGTLEAALPGAELACSPHVLLRVPPGVPPATAAAALAAGLRPMHTLCTRLPRCHRRSVLLLGAGDARQHVALDVLAAWGASQVLLHTRSPAEYAAVAGAAPLPCVTVLAPWQDVVSAALAATAGGGVDVVLDISEAAAMVSSTRRSGALRPAVAASLPPEPPADGPSAVFPSSPSPHEPPPLPPPSSTAAAAAAAPYMPPLEVALQAVAPGGHIVTARCDAEVDADLLPLAAAKGVSLHYVNDAAALHAPRFASDLVAAAEAVLDRLTRSDAPRHAYPPTVYAHRDDAAATLRTAVEAVLAAAAPPTFTGTCTYLCLPDDDARPPADRT